MQYYNTFLFSISSFLKSQVSPPGDYRIFAITYVELYILVFSHF